MLFETNNAGWNLEAIYIIFIISCVVFGMYIDHELTNVNWDMVLN